MGGHIRSREQRFGKIKRRSSVASTVALFSKKKNDAILVGFSAMCIPNFVFSLFSLLLDQHFPIHLPIKQSNYLQCVKRAFIKSSYTLVKGKVQNLYIFFS